MAGEEVRWWQVKKKAGGQLLVESAPDRIRAWKAKAAASGMSIKQWVEHSLDAAPVLTVTVQPRKAP